MKRYLKPGIILVVIASMQLFFMPGRIPAEEDPALTGIEELIEQMDALIEERQFEQAIAIGEEALEKTKKVFGQSNQIVARVLKSLGECYYEQADYEKCESLFNQTLIIREKALGPDHPDVAQSLSDLAIVYYSQGKYSEVESLWKRSLAIREKAPGTEHPDVAESLHDLATLYTEQGRYAEAEPLFNRSKSIWEKAFGPEHPYVAASLNNLASLYLDQGRYAEAEPLLNQSLAIWEKAFGPEHPYVASSLNNLASLYSEQEKYIKAEPFFKRALSIKEKVLGPEHPGVATSLNNLAGIYWRQGRYVDAEPLLKRSLSISEKTLGFEHPDVAQSMNNLAAIYRDQGRYAEAEPLYKRALAIWERALGPDHPNTGACLGSLAIVCGSSGKTDQSLVHYEKLQQSRQNFIEYVFSYASEDQKLRYIEKYPLLDHSLLSYAIINGRKEPTGSAREVAEKTRTELRSTALEMALRAKAVVIDAVSAEKEIAFCSYDEEIRRKAEKHAQVCGEISALTLTGYEQIDPAVYRERLAALYQEKDALETELSNNCSEFKEALAAGRFKVSDVANAIPLGSVLWEFVCYEPYDFTKTGNDKERTGPPRYLAFTLDREGEITLKDLGDAEAIDQLIHSARERLYKAREEAYFPVVIQSEKQLNQVTAELYETIFAPLASRLGDRTDILISPDGQLNLLPFKIFPCPDGQYVIEKFRISYLSSGRDLLRFKKKQESTDWAMVMADPEFNLAGEALAAQRDKTLNEPEVSPVLYAQSRGVSGCFNHRFTSLRYSRRETASVVQALEDQARLKARYYCGGNALEEVLKGMPAAPRVLHLATHGFFCDDVEMGQQGGFENPLLRCGLALTGANCVMDKARKDESRKEDGILTAFEVSGLNLVGTELVTLSACETGVGEVKNGEGVYGLRRAFQHAGARSIMMSLWKVRDRETCELMEGFYQNWLGGQSKREALRQSALKILASQREKHQAGHPYFWGAFVLLGDPN